MKDRWGKRAVKSEWEREEGSDTVRQSKREGSRQRDGCSRVAEVRRWCNDQITDTLEPSSRPSCPQKKKEKIWRHTWTRGKPAAVNGPAVRVHLGGGGRAGVDYQSLRLEEPTPALQFSPDGREVCSFCSTTLSHSQISCLTVRRQQSCWRAGGPEGSYLMRSFSNIRNDQYTSKK